MSALESVERRLRDRGGRAAEIVDVLDRIRRRAQHDRVSIVAAGLAFYGMLSVIPAAVAASAIYAVIRDPAELSRQAESWTQQMPFEVQRLVVGSVLEVANRAGASLGLGFVGALLVTFWASSRLGNALMQALNVVHGIDRDRQVHRRRGIAVALTVTLLVLGSVGVAFVDVAQKLVDASWWRLLVTGLTWAFVVAVFAAVSALAYRYGPNRPDAEVGWRSPGVVVSAVVFTVSTAVLFAYVSLVGSSLVYGALGIPLAFGLWLSAVSWGLLIGAYVNVEVGGADRDG